MDYNKLIEQQRAFLSQGGMLGIAARKVALQKLRDSILAHEQDILAALHADLHKSDFEGYMTEIGIILDELRYLLKHMGAWSKNQRVKTPLVQFPAKSFMVPEPYGVVLIMAPWNYPFQLCMAPLIGAVCAGNTVVLKPSAYAPATSRVVANIIADTFDKGHVAVVQGGRKENEALLEQRFDYIFFTGSVEVGRIVMEKASRHLTPVSLELGGKSPAIVDSTADVALAAKRIAFGKFLNAGQTCIAPDYVLVDRQVKDSFIAYLKQEIENFFPQGDYSKLPSIINKKHFHRLMNLMQEGQVLFGGTGDEETLHIAPTVIDGITFDCAIMQEEIFGPILPIIVFTSIDEAVGLIQSKAKPLALYIFTTDKQTEQRFTNQVSFGGGCINDTIIHMATSYMGFGGIGESGMGSYHGKASFDTFTHYKGMVKKSNRIDLPVRYHPYTEAKFKLLRKLLR
ncbi:MAG: aldehyde dehydrogenase [Sphaerochaetaceae bacterium]